MVFCTIPYIPYIHFFYTKLPLLRQKLQQTAAIGTMPKNAFLSSLLWHIVMEEHKVVQRLELSRVEAGLIESQCSGGSSWCHTGPPGHCFLHHRRHSTPLQQRFLSCVSTPQQIITPCPQRTRMWPSLWYRVKRTHHWKLMQCLQCMRSHLSYLRPHSLQYRLYPNMNLATSRASLPIASRQNHISDALFCRSPASLLYVPLPKTRSRVGDQAVSSTTRL